jgi:hypothetical protein
MNHATVHVAKPQSTTTAQNTATGARDGIVRHTQAQTSPPTTSPRSATAATHTVNCKSCAGHATRRKLDPPNSTPSTAPIGCEVLTVPQPHPRLRTTTDHTRRITHQIPLHHPRAVGATRRLIDPGQPRATADLVSLTRRRRNRRTRNRRRGAASSRGRLSVLAGLAVRNIQRHHHRQEHRHRSHTRLQPPRPIPPPHTPIRVRIPTRLNPHAATVRPDQHNRRQP